MHLPAIIDDLMSRQAEPACARPGIWRTRPAFLHSLPQKRSVKFSREAQRLYESDLEWANRYGSPAAGRAWRDRVPSCNSDGAQAMRLLGFIRGFIEGSSGLSGSEAERLP